ncbi:helix-turn-helix domain-containing protein [Halopseudomonas phragmitis]|uniref:AraC family transcriptional regulator n=1 Tax=Halopseudomonas phragmitis TaxID=1931241 RepID=A0A1V0B356_9GAMM|nr:AraC family transcriptional regulator [Halopseudomonas phragmitis]AQZ94368.1 AraC family transcriptional regulator [Halopseudomonas phragmitis]
MATHPLPQLPFASRSILASTDYAEAEALINSNLNEQRSVLPSRARAQADIQITLQALSEIKLFGAHWGDAVTVRSSPLACWHGILPLTGGVSCRQGGQSAGAGELLLFAPEHEIDITWHDDTRAVVMALNTGLLREHLASQYQLELPQVRQRVLSIGREHPALASLGHLLQLTDAELRQGGGLLNSALAQRQFQSLFCETLLQLVPELQALPERQVLPGLVKRAVDFIHAHLDQPLGIDDLVRISGASRRSLEQAFRFSLQTSPMRYVLHCRLQAAHQCLRQAHPGELQLADVAFRFGFSQPSHFTTAYKQAFGELPSQTLAR